MFAGYYGRRRLRALLNSVTFALTLTLVIYYRRNASSINQILYKFRMGRTFTSNQRYNHILLQRDSLSSLDVNSLSDASPSQASKGILSLIEFYHSSTIQLNSSSWNVVPIIVLSNASNIEMRDAIRRTWAFNQSYDSGTIPTKVYFLVGVDDFTQKRVIAEQMLFGDVIQVGLPDMHSFFAYKELSAMLWVKLNYPTSPLYIKTEDNVIMNMKNLNNVILPILNKFSNENLVISWFQSETSAPRGRYQKLINAILPPSQIDLYYAMSLFYAVTSKAIDYMIDALSHVDYIEHPGDPFVTGILRDAARVQMKDLSSSINSYTYELSDGKCRATIEKTSNLLFCTVAENVRLTRSTQEYFDVWDMLITKN
ncbi:unnamed protein product [Rotaria socialis]|uniref:Hexosyltransferase n=1 Tax=Rotaria socialis TaxID=392032 RepID=A0A818RL08_9BILA|nr:unnamed protein product [Rotaria socialis]CAF3408982.1 unnamed protein product [Rotaria socialis]CAF3650928.1 unnamed protein product [Rotaria socialis]CAF4248640.1 unnamed protein product [Rotaria socialis]CAF4278412.1 unnamed protein product [Rotaria socialis]